MSDKEANLQAKLEATSTWAVAVVCFVMLAISILIEHILEELGKWLKKKHQKALHEALEKVKGELMLLGFISLLLVVFQDRISTICIPKSIASTWHPCDPDYKSKKPEGYYDKCAEKGKDLVAFMSEYSIHQLHIFVFVLAIFHILQCIMTLTLGRTKMSKWRKWEDETKSVEHQFYHDPERFRFARDTTFGRRHLSSWSRSPISLWIVSFFRQFYRSLNKVDYMALRHGFIVAHLTPASEAKFDFQNYIKRTLDEDFAVVVGITPTIWFFAVLILLTNTHGWHSYLWIPFIPVINAFQLAFFAWSTFDNGFKINSCFHRTTADIVIRLTMGVLTQVLCSYVTLPLYALVTQMGSTMKPTIFNENVATALMNWHHSARNHIKHNKGSTSNTPFSSRPGTPTHGMSPVHLLHKHPRHSDSPIVSPMAYNYENEQWGVEGIHSPNHHARDHDHDHGETMQMQQPTAPTADLPPSGLNPIRTQHEINIALSEFSFGRGHHTGSNN
ncbi:hypothetical protein JHK82_056737 [Glycine max]|nr:hypothetical protein JHK82_056737 [Glycine max]